jgi:hypothetical protein
MRSEAAIEHTGNIHPSCECYLCRKMRERADRRTDSARKITVAIAKTVRRAARLAPRGLFPPAN